MDISDSVRRTQPLLGTFVEIAVAGADRHDLQQMIDEAFAAVAQVHRLMSFHDPHSDVSRLNREASTGTIPVHAWTYQVLEMAMELHRQSAGVFDVTVAPLLQQCGLLPRRVDDPAPAMDQPSAEAALELLGDGRIRYRHPGIRIDLGGIAKGFAVDRALEVLRQHGLTRGLVNAGGDLAAFGPEPELVHIRHPANAGCLLGTAAIANAALATSGRTVDLLQLAAGSDCAVFDPGTQRPVRGIVGATVRAPSCMVADALTKVVMITGEGAESLLRHRRANALFVLESGDVWIAPDWQDAVRLAA
jgi:thiamine biosynthesis lipoprotein